MSKRCIVIGAGISGLCFAERYRRLNPGAELTVLEASPRVGASSRPAAKTATRASSAPRRSSMTAPASPACSTTSACASA
jgi:cation diffusion facilitator CzcD-associated flavoprotein CzcO